MSKVLIPAGLTGKALFTFLVANKDALVTEKKSFPKFTDAFTAKTSRFHVKTGVGLKSEVIDQVDDEQETGSGDGAMDASGDVLRVKVVANTMNWCDSQMDVLINDCAKRTIKERKKMIPHLHDHIHSIEAKVGETVDIYLADMSLKDLGINMPGTTQCIIQETDVMRSYNEKIFNQYKLGKINQHSIGLQYIKIELAINDTEYEKEMDFWNKYYPVVLNKDVVDEKGYFWVVSEIKLLENSCVLFGSNELTPTLEAKSNTSGEPPIGTQQNPLTTTEGAGNNKSAIDWDKMAIAFSI